MIIVIAQRKIPKPTLKTWRIVISVLSTDDVPEMPSLTLTDDQKVLLRKSWQIIYDKMGKDLSYVGSNEEAGQGDQPTEDGGVAATFLTLFKVWS